MALSLPFAEATSVGSPALNIGIFAAFVVITLTIVIRVSSGKKTAEQYYTASGAFSGRQNGIAIAGDYLSAASFLGIAGAIALTGYDGFLYSIGFLVAWLVALLLVAELMRNTAGSRWPTRCRTASGSARCASRPRSPCSPSPSSTSSPRWPGRGSGLAAPRRHRRGSPERRHRPRRHHHDRRRAHRWNEGHDLGADHQGGPPHRRHRADHRLGPGPLRLQLLRPLPGRREQLAGG